MGTVHRFPLEEVDYFRSTDYGSNATILILPIVKIERYEPLLCEETFAAMRTSFAELHTALAGAPPDAV